MSDQTLFTLIREGDTITILDQTRLPFETVTRTLDCIEDVETAIKTMQVRGAPLIGITAAYGVAMALGEAACDSLVVDAVDTMLATRPTAVNLKHAMRRMHQRLLRSRLDQRQNAAWQEADAMFYEDVNANRAIGQHGVTLLQEIYERTGKPVRVMTHCNAGWLATVAWGTALAPVYLALEQNIPVEVWVSETRPRNQGLLTAWELSRAGIPHTFIADNAAGALIANGQVDCVLVGADRIAANGDTANKVGTYLKALAAHAAGVPFWVAAPINTFDASCDTGKDIPIEERDGDEVRTVQGENGSAHIANTDMRVFNPAFDVTPASLITGFINERGIVLADKLEEHMEHAEVV